MELHITNFQSKFEDELYQELKELPEIELDPESQILKTGDYIREIPLLLKGSIKVSKTDASGKEIILYHIAPGESCILSITSSLNNKISKADAIIEEPSKLLIVRADDSRKWMDIYPGWRRFVMELYYDKLDKLLQLVDDIAFKQLDIRLIEKLNVLRQIQGETIYITHQSLANELGTAREVVSRLLKQLEASGKIKLERGKIIIYKAL